VSRPAAIALAVCLLATTVPARTQPSPADTDFSGAAKAAASLPQLHSLLVSWRGERVVEYYAKGRSGTRLANVKSVSKSVIAALVGIAIDKGLIKSVREPIVTWFPELRKAADPRKQRITIEDLLTMR
jgi:CubicO group peptidase (beta-lactamase class C family)